MLSIRARCKKVLAETSGPLAHRWLRRPAYTIIQTSSVTLTTFRKAKEILAASGYPKGFQDDSYVWHPRYPCQRICGQFKYMLAQIGIEASVQPLASAANVKNEIRRLEKWRHTGQCGYLPEKDLGRSMLNQFSKYSILFRDVARSAEYDAIMDKLITEPDFDKRVTLNQQLMKQMIDRDCMIQISFNNGWIYVKPPNLNDDHIGDIWLHQSTPKDAWFSK